MSKPVVVLGATTLALAASTIWLALRLNAAHEELAALQAGSKPAAEIPANTSLAAMPPPTTAEAANPDHAANANPRGEAKAPATASAVAPAADDLRVQMRASLEQQLPYMRATLEDPEKRAAFVSSVSRNLQREFPQMAAHLELSEDEIDRLANLLATQQLRLMEMRYQCALNPNCDGMSFATRYRQAADQELIDLLGTEGKRRFDDYRDFAQERRQVASMRGDMPDALRITDAQAEKLAAALGEERRRMVKELEQSGASQSGLTTALGSIFYAESNQGVEQRMAEASEYARRLRERAATVLNPGQLEFFNNRQQQFLEQLREHLENEARSGRPTTP